LAKKGFDFHFGLQHYLFLTFFFSCFLQRLVASPVSYITKSNLTLSYRGAGKKEPKAQIQNQKGADNKQQGKKTGSQQQKNNTAGNAVNGKNNNSSKPQAQRVKRFVNLQHCKQQTNPSQNLGVKPLAHYLGLLLCWEIFTFVASIRTYELID
jgi:hypothetical protein